MKKNILYTSLIIILLLIILSLVVLLINLYNKYKTPIPSTPVVIGENKEESQEQSKEQQQEQPEGKKGETLSMDIVEEPKEETEQLHTEFFKYRIKPREAKYYEPRTFNENLLEGKAGK